MFGGKRNPKSSRSHESFIHSPSVPLYPSPTSVPPSRSRRRLGTRSTDGPLDPTCALGCAIGGELQAVFGKSTMDVTHSSLSTTSLYWSLRAYWTPRDASPGAGLDVRPSLGADIP